MKKEASNTSDSGNQKSLVIQEDGVSTFIVLSQLLSIHQFKYLSNIWVVSEIVLDEKKL